MNVPRLRFKEFGGDWKENNLLDLSQNGFSNGVFNDPSKVGSGYKLVNVIDMYLDTAINEDTLPLIELSVAEFLKNKVEYGDIFFTRSSLVKEGIAYSNVYLNNSDDVTFDGHLVRMRPKKELINSVFLNYMLKTSKVRCQLVMRGKTATMTTIGQSDIATVIVSFPILPEQTKIANFLTAIDAKIANLTQKHELLARYKKGVMQQIFGQQLRFKDDDWLEFPVWEEKSLGELSVITTGSSNREDSSLDGEYTFFDRSEDIRTSSIFLFDGEAVIVAGEGQRFIPKYFVGKFDLHQRTYAIMQFNEAIGKFIYYTIYYKQNYFLSQAVGSTVKSLRLPMFQQMPIELPSIKEQTKIANFLTALDDKLTNTKNQLDVMKQYKQGLLQQLFV